jgi:hypothetical protein
MVIFILIKFYVNYSLKNLKIALSRSAPSVDEFFQINGDYSTIKWSHAVNSISELEQALNGIDILSEIKLLRQLK